MIYLQDKSTTELLYGGAASGGKTFLGCVWITGNLIKYPGTRWLIGRARLNALKKTTLLTLFDLLKQLRLKRDKDYHYNSSNSVLTFWNGSEIYLQDLYQDPSDPEFDTLGSSEYTGAFIDEGAQITSQAKSVVLSRLRYKTKEYGIIGKMLVASNPTKNFLYYDFYKPWKDNKLPIFRRFVQALPQDNPHSDPNYLMQLSRLDTKTKARLLYGDWEYDADPSKLIEYEKILDMWTNTPVPSDRRYITSDIARMGDDKTTIYYWEGLTIKDLWVRRKQSTRQTRLDIEEMARRHQVPRSNIIVDEDGVGGGVKDETPGIKGFINNSKPIEQKKTSTPNDKAYQQKKHNYANLKTQCYFMLADYVNLGKIAIDFDMDPEDKKNLIEEMEQIKQKDADKDGTLKIVPKDEVKKRLGRSPDYSDGIMLRMFFEICRFVTPEVSRARIYG